MDDSTSYEASDVLALHYEAAETMLGTKILSMVLFDRKTGEGRAWTRSTGFSASIAVSYDALVRRDLEYVAEGSREKFLEELAMDRVVATVDASGRCEATEKYRGPDGRTRYFCYHFSAYERDPQLLFAVVEDMTELHEREGRSIEDLYDNVPGGLVSYELVDGALMPLHVSNRYRGLFGEPPRPCPGAPAAERERLHPEDLAGYVTEVIDALSDGREAHHAYRVWMPEDERYMWVKIDAVAKDMADGRVLVYAMYSDVTEMMGARHALTKTSESLEAALKVSNQMIWEYDPTMHVATCYTEENAFGLPRVIEGYPESLDAFDIFIAEDAAVFRDTVHEIDAGAEEAHCDARIRVDGEPRWFSCTLFSRTDPVLGRRTATLFVTDINVRKAAIQAFENRVGSLLYSGGDALSVGVYNISRGEVLEIRADQGVLAGDAYQDYDEVLAEVAGEIVDPEARRRYLQTFSRENLLALAAAGGANTRMECLYRVEPGHTEWTEISAELLPNPISGEVEVIGFAKSINEFRLSKVIITQALKGSFNSVSILLEDGAEYYLFDDIMGSLCAHHLDYWGDLGRVFVAICDDAERARLGSLVEKDVVLAQLDAGKSPRIPFYGTIGGRRRRLEISFSRVEGEGAAIYASVRDITDGAMLEKLRRDARHDPLTGLYNRGETFARCERLLAENPDETFVMLKLNVRRFRLYNDFFGEEAGDELLREVGRQMGETLDGRPLSVYGRMESDIFCAFFSLDESVLTARLETVARRFADYRDDFLLEPSIGIYVVTDRSLSVEGMFARASSAAKEGGTRLASCAWCYNDQLERTLEGEVAITSEMHAALEQGQFKVYLQPKFDLQTGAHAGAEALVRWVHPTRGMISPGEFIPVFERNGFIASLDRYMWEEVCKLIRRWQDEGREVRPVSVNVSRVSAYSPTIVGFLISLVRRYGIDPGLLELELTESAYIANPEEIHRRMRALQEAGFRILMDDFGSGYSSLNTLRKLPVDMLKLDIGFLSEACDDDRDRAVIDSVLAMTGRLGLPVIAEGVENERQADYLRSVGCEFVQGYFFARPMPVGDYEALLG